MWYTKTVKIPEKHYINFRDQTNMQGESLAEEQACPLGFMTPFGTDKAFEKRKETVDNWSDGGWYRRQKQPYDTSRSKILDNNPISGFKLTFDIRNGYKGSPDAWKIADPRGFKLEIRSDNLAQLMKETEIRSGEIIGECVWAREGGRNVLLSVNTEEYKAAVITTKAASTPMAKTVPIKNVKLGSMVTLDNGYKGKYLGRYYVFNSGYQELIERHFSKYVYVFHVMDYRVSRHGKCAAGGMIYTRNTAKIVSIDDDTNLMTAKEAEAFTHGLVGNGDVANSLWQSQFFSMSKNPSFETGIMTDGKDLNEFRKTQCWDGKIYTRYNNLFGHVRSGWGLGKTKIEMYVLNEQDLINGKVTNLQIPNPNYTGSANIWTSYSSRNPTIHHQEDIPDDYNHETYRFFAKMDTGLNVLEFTR